MRNKPGMAARNARKIGRRAVVLAAAMALGGAGSGVFCGNVRAAPSGGGRGGGSASVQTDVHAPQTSSQAPAVLIGIWTLRDARPGGALSLMLKGDGSGKLGDSELHFSAVGDATGGHLMLVIGSDTINYTYTLDGDLLIVAGGDLDGPTAFVRQLAKRGIGAKLAALHTTDENAGSARPAGLSGNAVRNPIVGRWVSEDGGVFDFGADGVLQFQGSICRYAIAGDSLTIDAPGGRIAASFAVRGAQMALTLDGKIQILTREGVSGGAEKSGGAGSPVDPSPDHSDPSPAPPVDPKQSPGKVETPLQAAGPRGAEIGASEQNAVGRGRHGLHGGNVVGNAQPAAAIQSPAPASPGASGESAAAPAQLSAGLLGIWQDESGARVQFNADNTLLFGGNSFPYRVEANVITVVANGSTLQWPYEIKADHLLVTVSGQLQILTRVVPAAAAAPSPAIVPTGAVQAAPQEPNHRQSPRPPETK